MYQEINVLRNRIQEKVDDPEHYSQIVAGVFNYLVQSHQQFCSCDYCNILRQYVETKRKLNHHNRLMSRKANQFCFDDDYSITIEDMDDNFHLRMKIKELKQQKNDLKKTYFI